MPKCKNDPTKTYKGTEPSPKGLGWCAHSEKIGKKRKGKDNNIWIVKEVKDGIKRWVKFKKEENNKKIISKSKFVNDRYNDYKNNKNIIIKKIYKGKEAFDKVKLLFFGKINNENSRKWSENFNKKDINQSIFIIFIYTKGVVKITKYITFRFIIDNDNERRRSDLGEKYKYRNGLLKIEDYKKIIK